MILFRHMSIDLVIWLRFRPWATSRSAVLYFWREGSFSLPFLFFCCPEGGYYGWSSGNFHWDFSKCKDFFVTWPRAWKCHKAWGPGVRTPEKINYLAFQKIRLFNELVTTLLNSSYGLWLKQSMPVPTLQIKDVYKWASAFSLRNLVVFAFLSPTPAFDLGDSLHRDVWSKTSIL